MRQLAARWNEGDMERYLELFDPDVVFLSSESWPETGRYEGREAMRQFATDFRGVWDDVKLEIVELFPGTEAVAATCNWITRGRASGVEGRLTFPIVIWAKDGRIARGQFFDELEDALEAAGATGASPDRAPG